MTTPATPAGSTPEAGPVAKPVDDGMAGVIVARSAICRVSPERHGLLYRGYRCSDLAARCTFEEVAYLLMHQELPARREVNLFARAIRKWARPLPALKKMLDRLPDEAPAMDVMRTGLSAVGAFKNAHPLVTADDIRDRFHLFLGEAEMVLALWAVRLRGVRYVGSREKSLAGRLLEYLTGAKPTAEQTDAMQTSLILYAEHGFNA
ncbi:MAG: citrate/2-methylcitrate synthase, partial [Planctomycetota bacterium]